MNRVQQIGNVAQCRSLNPALGEGASRVAVKADYHEIIARKEQLAQIVIPVSANAKAAKVRLQDRAESRECRGFALDQLPGQSLGRLGHPIDVIDQKTEDPPREVSHRLIYRTLVKP